MEKSREFLVFLPFIRDRKLFSAEDDPASTYYILYVWYVVRQIGANVGDGS